MTKELQDLVWSILPKEFKEEVKETYREYTEKIATKSEPEYRIVGYIAAQTELELLFGLHNLTSDADGEEMLIVSRKEVQEAYKERACASACYNKWEEEYLKYNSEMALLKSLFGSKCLPDEKEFAENANCKEPKSAEPKFKRGDMVIYKPTRKVKVVFGIDKYGRYCVALPNMQSPMYVDESDLEPYTEPKQPVSDCHHLQEPKPAEPSETLCMDSEGFYRKGMDEHDNKVKVRIPSGETEPYTEPKEDHFVVNNEMVKDFDNILKDGFSKERRLNIASMAMQGMLSNTTRFSSYEISDLVRISLNCADALIAECEKGGLQ